jgi:hypothetical protein
MTLHLGGGVVAEYKCRTCAFWDGGTWRDPQYTHMTAECRRHAPIIQDDDRAAVWPLTLNDDSCGDWLKHVPTERG